MVLKFQNITAFNIKLAREAGVGLHPAHVSYMSLINMNPLKRDTMLTTMKLVKLHSDQAGQEYTVFAKDRELFKIAT